MIGSYLIGVSSPGLSGIIDPPSTEVTIFQPFGVGGTGTLPGLVGSEGSFRYGTGVVPGIGFPSPST